MVSPIGNKGWELHILEGLSQLSELHILEGLQRPFQMQILLANESTHLQKVRTQRKSTILSFLEREQTASLRSLTGSLLYRRTWCWVLSSRAIFRRPLSYPLRPFEILSCLDQTFKMFSLFGQHALPSFRQPIRACIEPHCISLVPWLHIRLKKRFQNPNGQGTKVNQLQENSTSRQHSGS